MAKRKARKDKINCGNTQGYSSTSEPTKLKATAAAQKKFIAINEDKSKANDM